MSQPPRKTVPKQITDAIKAGEAKLAGTAPGTPAEGTPQPQAAAPPAPPVELPPIPTPAGEPAAAPAPVVEPTSQPQPIDLDLGDQGTQPAQPKPAPGPKPGETPEETIRRMGTAMQRLQEKYNAEVPQLMRENAGLKKHDEQARTLARENDSLRQSIVDLEKRIADTEARITATPQQPGAITDDLKTLAEEWAVDPQQLADFQKQTIDAVLAKLPKSQSAEPAKVPAPAGTAPQPAPAAPQPMEAPERALYFSTLDMLIGGTEAQGSEYRKQVVADPDFGVFLDMTDKTTLRPVRETAMQADAANNAVVMSKIYTAFNRWKTSKSQPTKPSHLMPKSEGGPSGDLNTNQKPVYTAAQEAEFQRRVRSQHYAGIGKKPEDAARLADEYRYWSDEFATARAGGRIQG